MSDPDFMEIEHKFAVREDFDPDLFESTLLSLGPSRLTEVEVRDVYYRVEGRSDYMFRHRFDEELQQLTVKSFGDDTEMRREINLDLGFHKGDQQRAVDAFLEILGVTWKGTLYKRIKVYYLPDCEAVYYEAWKGDDPRRKRFVEFESKNAPNTDEAIAVIEKYERLTGFDGVPRERKSLVELIFPELEKHA